MQRISCSRYASHSIYLRSLSPGALDRLFRLACPRLSNIFVHPTYCKVRRRVTASHSLTNCLAANSTSTTTVRFQCPPMQSMQWASSMVGARSVPHFSFVCIHCGTHPMRRSAHVSKCPIRHCPMSAPDTPLSLLPAGYRYMMWRLGASRTWV